jgi:hypothetical protein
MSDQSPGKLGAVGRIVEMLKSLTLTNVLVIILLGLVCGPAYLTWRIINDEGLLRMIFSNFEERSMPGTDCALRVASQRAAAATYYISISYAYSGNDRWYIGVNTPVEPSPEDAKNYCRVLDEIIDYARGTGPLPTFPYSKRSMFQPRPEKE